MTDPSKGDTPADKKDDPNHHAPGTSVLVLILLVSFAVYYFANWKALAGVWPVR